MRLLMVNYEFPPIGGGAGNAHKFLLHQFVGQRDLHVDVLTSGLEPGLIQEDFAPNVRIYKVGLHKKELHFWRKSEIVTWLFKARRVYDNLLNQNSYDLAHAFFAFPSAWLCYRRVNRLPYLISLRGSDVPGYNDRLGLDYKLLAGLFRRIWSGAAGVVANSRGLCDLASAFMPALDIKVIPNGVDTDRFFPVAKKPAASPMRLLTVGRLISRKRTEWMLIALKHLNDAGCEAFLTIAGAGPESDALKEKTVNLDLDDQVWFKGIVPSEEIPALYRDHDIFVMCSDHEGMSNAMLEALASGLPVVTTACEGAEELISGCGRIVISSEPADIAAALQELIDDPQQHRVMSSAARQRAEEFTWTVVAEAYLNEYKRIIGENIP